MPKTKLAPVALPETTLQDRVEEYLDVKVALDRLTLHLDTLKKGLKQEAFLAHKAGETLETPTHKVLYVESHNVTITADILRGLGVKETTILRAIKRGTSPYAYPRVVEKKEAKVEREEQERGKR